MNASQSGKGTDDPTQMSCACPFGLNDIPIFEPTASSYCRGDIVRSVDRDSHIPGPSCVLGEFIPYTRP